MFTDLRYLTLSITCRCNLRCKYCYQAAGSAGMDMSDEIIDQTLELADNGKPLLIQITGGEPTLVPDAIMRIAEKSLLLQVRPRLAIQTNGTLLTPDLVALLQKYDIQVGVSVDGPPDLQEALRGCADATLHGLQLLEENGVNFRVTTVVSSANVLALDRLALMLAGFGRCRGIGLDLLINKGRASNSLIFPAHSQQLRKGITRFVHTLKGLNSRRSLPILLREMELVKNGPSSHAFCHAALDQSLAVQADGSLFPCGQTVGDPFFLSGTISNPLRENRFPLTTVKLPSEKCDACPLQGQCPGECPSRLHYNSNDNSTLVCELYRCLTQ